MYKKLYILLLLFILCITEAKVIALDNNVYIQTLNMGDEEYFIEDNTIYPEESQNPSIQYIENNYNYIPQQPYDYKNYIYPGYGSYTITSPIYRPIYRPYYVNTKPIPISPIKPIPPGQKLELRPTNQRPFSYNYGYTSPKRNYTPSFQNK